MLCPICGSDHVFVRGHYVHRGSGDARGVVDVLRMKCEDGGHEFEVCLGMHKRYTALWCRDLRVRSGQYLQAPALRAWPNGGATWSPARQSAV